MMVNLIESLYRRFAGWQDAVYDNLNVEGPCRIGSFSQSRTHLQERQNWFKPSACKSHCQDSQEVDESLPARYDVFWLRIQANGLCRARVKLHQLLASNYKRRLDRDNRARDHL